LPTILRKFGTSELEVGDIVGRSDPEISTMNVFPLYDVSAAGSLAASVCASEAKEQAPALKPPPFAAAPRQACSAQTIAACRKSGWRRLAGALFDLVSGPRLER
jgi:hypothetical protein